MSFVDAMAVLIPEEGGYTLVTLNDGAGLTYAGISRNNFPKWSGWTLIDAGDRDSAQLKALVQFFYSASFWVPLQCGQLPARIATLVFDFGVNAGINAASKALQRAAGVNPDGQIGAKTIAAVGAADPERLLRLLFAEQIAYYLSCKQWPEFGKGWIFRAVDELRKI